MNNYGFNRFNNSGNEALNQSDILLVIFKTHHFPRRGMMLRRGSFHCVEHILRV